MRPDPGPKKNIHIENINKAPPPNPISVLSPSGFLWEHFGIYTLMIRSEITFARAAFSLSNY